MTRKTVTEEELGLAPTEDELETAVVDTQDDVSEDDTTAAEAEPAKSEPAKPADEPKMVDVRALQEARAEAREARERAAVMEQRWNDFLATQNKPKVEEPAIPKWDDDPVTAGQWTQDQLLAMRQEQADRQREQEEATRQSQEQERILGEAAAEFQASAQSDPSVKEAYEALVGSFRREAEFYPGMTPQQRQAYMTQTEMQHIAYARQNRIPLNEYIKGLASARGWNPQPATAAPQPAKTDLASVAAAQQRHQSLSDAPGGDAPAPLDAKALAKMSDKDFKAWIAKKGNESKFDEIMGG